MPCQNCENPVRNDAEDPPPPGQSRRQMREQDIQSLQNQVRIAKEGQQRAEQEAHDLQAQINQQNGQNQGVVGAG
ncbi:hypothetical protein RhiXN_02438 [Rhizoctonia solani]|uniref:Uncharacterized protein n=1 Tax=Rhizoctonia solani TaxID=456999 RepID=A0A8H8ST58_9AGAM|nr:uncharacterized protein RhiXN_02435 [Rhizoctonia solani]XP_043177753.1 uncharacterized protein RhiXN_02438 [Rhizoctonia solani]QRW17513.1 hypothetical protein RhiXN_02435 [Rhizoctonia solani]QRW17516.1 hypothetical protein RhiXN_02438 [Rhizoctonia solani]